VELELFPKERSILRKPPQVVLVSAFLTAVVAKAELTVDQVHCRLDVLANCGIPLQISLGGNGLARLPALALINMQDVDQLLGRQGAELRKESVQLRSLALLPKLAKALGRVGGPRRLVT
jgi:hypothetical protein